MKLKTSIFLWVFLTTAIPILLVTLYATMYSEGIYRKAVNAEVANSLDNIASEVRRRLLLDRDVLSGLSRVAPVQAFLPVLTQVAMGDTPPDLHEHIRHLEQFLEEIQEIVSATSQFRVLDLSGKCLVKAKDGRPSGIDTEVCSPSEEASASDTGIGRASFQKLAQGLLPGEIRYFLDPGASLGQTTSEPVTLYDMILALGKDERPVGYITAKIRYEPIDRLLDVSPRLHRGKLFIAEIDPDDQERNGLILYDDGAQVSLATEGLRTERLQELHPAIYASAQEDLFGFLDTPDGGVRTYYSEFFPYPDQLVTWVIGTQVDLHALATPFSRVRIVILTVALLALLSSLALARIGAKRIAFPITNLSGKLADFARRRQPQPIHVAGPDEIRRAGAAFNEMISSFEQAERERDQARTEMLQKAKLASVGQMAAGIGHEINNPLHNILTLTKLMNRHHPDLDKELREDISSVHEEAQRASRIVRALLDFSRESPLQCRLFEVGPWLTETLSLVEQEAKQQDIHVVADQKNEYLLEGDPNLLQQTLINLLRNGLQASDPGSEIHVTTSMKDQSLTIEVQDEGSGIAPEIQDRIFDPFFTSKTAREGSGLGLSISLGIVAQHGGEISVRNQPGGGVSARIVLPRARVVQRKAIAR